MLCQRLVAVPLSLSGEPFANFRLSGALLHGAQAHAMRFQFAGGADVPDWLLSQIFVVSRISAVKIKILAKLVLQQSRGEAIDQQKVSKLLGDGKLETHEVKGVVAALHFILTSSARHDVPEDALALELQQLGLPKEHTEGLVAALRDGRASLQSRLADASLRLPRLAALRWRVHEDESSTRAHAVELHLGLQPQVPLDATSTPAAPHSFSFRVDAGTLTLLHSELKAARDGVEAVQPQKS